ESAERHIDDRHAEQAERDHQKAGDRTTAERDHESIAKAATGGAGDPHIGAHRHLHADVAGDSRAGSADIEGDQGLDTEVDVVETSCAYPYDNGDDDACYQCEYRDRDILPAQIGLGAGENGIPNFAHLGSAGII